MTILIFLRISSTKSILFLQSVEMSMTVYDGHCFHISLTFLWFFNLDLSLTSRTPGKGAGESILPDRWETHAKSIFFFSFLLYQGLPITREDMIWQNFRFECTNKWRRRGKGYSEAMFQSPSWGWVCTALLLACLHFKSRASTVGATKRFYEIARPAECH